MDLKIVNPENVDVSQLTDKLNQIEGVTNIHDVHIWRVWTVVTMQALYTQLQQIYS